MALYERDKGGQLIPTSGEIPEEAIAVIERADEQAIIERLTRTEAQPYFAYSYPIKTKEGIKEIIGISVDGAKEIARQLGNIKASTDIKVEEKDDYYYVIIPVTDLVRNVTLLGVGRQSKYIIGEGMVPTDRIDETSFVKAFSKAQRNGVLSVAPQETIAEIVSKLDSKAIKKLPGPPAPPKALTKTAPPRAEKPEESSEEKEIKSLRQQLHLQWDNLQKMDESIGNKKDWLKTNYGVESSMELSLDDLRKAVSQVKGMIAERGEPPVNEEAKKALAKEMMAFFGQGKEAQEKTLQLFRESTGKKGGWTQSDLERIRIRFEELKKAQPTADTEVEDFLKSLEG